MNLETLATKITLQMTNAHKSSIAIGRLLEEANKLHDNQKSFLNWAAKSFALGKSQVFKLIKVAAVFGDDNRFDGIATSVLYAISTQADEEITEACAVLAANKELNISSFKALMKPKQAPAIIPPTKVEPVDTGAVNAQVDESELAKQVPFETNKTAEKAEKAAQRAAEDKRLAELEARIVGENEEEDKQLNDSKDWPVNPLISQLQAQNDKLMSQLAELTQRLAEAGQAKRTVKAVAPMLMHFKSKNKALRLGLTPAEAKEEKAVREAFRAIVKAGYDAKHEAYPLLLEAKDALITKAQG